jgi:hypothetical protein
MSVIDYIKLIILFCRINKLEKLLERTILYCNRFRFNYNNDDIIFNELLEVSYELYGCMRRMQHIREKVREKEIN